MSTNDNIELTKDGVKLPYQRFLSDSAPGYILILVVFLTFYGHASFLGFNLPSDFVKTIPVEIQVYLGIIAFLLATPLGLMVNVFSWVSFEWVLKKIEQVFVLIKLPFHEFKNEYSFFVAKEHYKINYKNWPQKIRRLETLLTKHQAGWVVESIGPLRGISIFLRNIAFFGLLMIFDGLLVSKNHDELWLGLLILIVFLLASATTFFYFHVQILYWAYEEKISITKHYLFGYGSLINASSRQATGHTRNSHPVKVSGFQRSWCVPAPEMRFNGLGVWNNPSSQCNGVIVEIDEHEISLFDQRELSGSNNNYERVLINNAQIQDADFLKLDNARVWVYVVKTPQKPSVESPIIQSYVDVILAGCLEIGQDFAEEFIATTSGWEYPWVNDRTLPRYVRSQTGLDIKQIDQILEKRIPSQLKKRT